ncbi:MAG TPA: hypothetical protein VKC66_37515 [Xanthobacteraceae bacterium]|nr:hypothetical protein [Xanthobacteraceae bacterium]
MIDRTGKESSGDGNRKATISAGDGDGAMDRNETALKLTPRPATAAKTAMTKKANANLPALANT